jgi:TP901 family phage tail tape measure protein
MSQRVNEELLLKVISDTKKAERDLGNLQSVTDKLSDSVSQQTRVYDDNKGTITEVTDKVKHLEDEEGNLTTKEEQLTKTTKQMERGFLGLGESLEHTTKKVVLWGVSTGIVYTVVNSLQDLINEFLEVEHSMARVATVTRPATSELVTMEAVMKKMRTEALILGTQVPQELGKIAESLYLLGSAGLEVDEQLAGFEPIAKLSVATRGDLGTISKTVAGIVNNFEDDLSRFTGIEEKFGYVSDLISKTFSEQQVELHEISGAFQLAGSAAGLLDINLQELMGTIGFLNTGMLKGTRAGTALLNAMIKMGQKSDKLRESFGVVIDPNKPLSFIDVLQQLHDKIGPIIDRQAIMTELWSVFGIRGGRAVALILKQWDKYKDSIESLDESKISGFTDKLEELASDTLRSRLVETKNILFAILNLPTEGKGLSKLGDFIEKINSSLSEEIKLMAKMEELRKFGLSVEEIKGFGKDGSKPFANLNVPGVISGQVKRPPITPSLGGLPFPFKTGPSGDKDAVKDSEEIIFIAKTINELAKEYNDLLVDRTALTDPIVAKQMEIDQWLKSHNVSVSEATQLSIANAKSAGEVEDIMMSIGKQLMDQGSNAGEVVDLYKMINALVVQRKHDEMSQEKIDERSADALQKELERLEATGLKMEDQLALQMAISEGRTQLEFLYQKEFEISSKIRDLGDEELLDMDGKVARQELINQLMKILLTIRKEEQKIDDKEEKTSGKFQKSISEAIKDSIFSNIKNPDTEAWRALGFKMGDIIGSTASDMIVKHLKSKEIGNLATSILSGFGGGLLSFGVGLITDALFPTKKNDEEEAVEENTRALTELNLSIRTLNENFINAPSTFALGQTSGGGAVFTQNPNIAGGSGGVDTLSSQINDGYNSGSEYNTRFI